jgi:predicted metal-binding membrane protein
MPIEMFWRLLQHSRAVVSGALSAVIVAAWAYLWRGAGVEMEIMDMGGGRMMAMPLEWTLPYALLIFVMWVVMMAAMMLPGAAPTVLSVAVLAQGRLASSIPAPATAILFAAGYLLVWCGFSLAATFLQWGLDEAGLLSVTMAFGNETLAGAVLAFAGLYQWTPLKDTCLRHCRSPTEFLVRHWRHGALGAVLTGMRHGIFCFGCCWMLMALLFVVGLMNLAWVAVVALLVLLEKTIPWEGQMRVLTGVVLIDWGFFNLIRAVFPEYHV